MRNLSLEQFYKRISNKINLIGGYIEDKSICSIIRSCRLKPRSVFTDTFNFATTLEPDWIDEFGNTLVIKKKKAKLEFNYRASHNITTDIFKNEKVEFIVEHSKYACVGLYPETQNFILLLMGSDNYFRCYQYIGGDIKIVSPLVVGLKVLKCCVVAKPIEHFKKLTIKSELNSAKDIEWFIVPLPAHKLFMLNVVGYEKIRSMLYNGE